RREAGAAAGWLYRSGWRVGPRPSREQAGIKAGGAGSILIVAGSFGQAGGRIAAHTTLAYPGSRRGWPALRVHVGLVHRLGWWLRLDGPRDEYSRPTTFGQLPGVRAP